MINSDQTVAASAQARLKFVENTLTVIPNTEEKLIQALKEISALLNEYRQSLAKLIENSKRIDELTTEMTESAADINKASIAMKSDLLADQKRFEEESRATVGETEQSDRDAGRRRSAARRGLGVPAWRRHLPADDGDVQCDA